jgi:hypothetical protein
VLAVEREVEEVVDDVDGRCRRAERDEGEQAGRDHAEIEIFVRQHHRHGDQRVLRPLMGAQHLEVGLERRLRRVEQLGPMHRLPARGFAVGRNHDRGARDVEAGEVVTAVAGIVEAAVAIGADQHFAFAPRRQVERAVRGMDAVEQAEMDGDGFSELAWRAGSKDEAAAGVALAAQPLDQLIAIRQCGGVDIDARGDLLLQSGWTGEEPHGNQEQIERIFAQQQEQALPQEICRNQRAVEVDSERNSPVVRARVHPDPILTTSRPSGACIGI